ncbi:MAG TPA: alpha/beta hydrolase [Myxococcota bacterium]|nr:alpha/beta hydrolase [Myxococcota bacterium]
MPLWFLTGPPLSEAIFRAVIARIGKGEAVPLLDSSCADDGWQQRGEKLSARATAAGGVVLFAHGLSVPAAVAAAKLGGVRLLILSNGPITRLDPVSHALSRLSGSPGARAFLSRMLLHPTLWIPALASSLALRRTVVNPYVMDRDNVASLAEAGVATHAARLAVVAYLKSLRSLPDLADLSCPVWAIWGDADVLYPASEADYLDSSVGGAHHIAIPGGQHYHPEERPWELAGAVLELLEREGLSVGS